MSHPNNMKLYNLPTVMATIILIDPKNGAPLSIMEGSWITAMRTGAASGIASKYLARKDSHKLGLIGAGAQAETQILAISSIMNIKEVYIYE
jgi:alanine dehydrogenase